MDATPHGRLEESLTAVRAELARSEAGAPAQTLPHLRRAAEHLAVAIDEAMALAILEDGTSIRAVGALAGLSENAVPPRLARTAALAPYSDAAGRVSARAVERARYDVERGEHSPAPHPEPMRFRRRRQD